MRIHLSNSNTKSWATTFVALYEVELERGDVCFVCVLESECVVRPNADLLCEAEMRKKQYGNESNERIE